MALAIVHDVSTPEEQEDRRLRPKGRAAEKLLTEIEHRAAHELPVLFDVRSFLAATGLSQSAMFRALDELIREGLVERIKRGGRNAAMLRPLRQPSSAARVVEIAPAPRAAMLAPVQVAAEAVSESPPLVPAPEPVAAPDEATAPIPTAPGAQPAEAEPHPEADLFGFVAPPPAPKKEKPEVDAALALRLWNDRARVENEARGETAFAIQKAPNEKWGRLLLEAMQQSPEPYCDLSLDEWIDTLFATVARSPFLNGVGMSPAEAERQKGKRRLPWLLSRNQARSGATNELYAVKTLGGFYGPVGRAPATSNRRRPVVATPLNFDDLEEREKLADWIAEKFVQEADREDVRRVVLTCVETAGVDEQGRTILRTARSRGRGTETQPHYLRFWPAFRAANAKMKRARFEQW